MGGTLAVTAIGDIKVFWFQNGNYQFFGSQAGNAITEIVIALLFIWGVTWSAILSLRVGKWLSVYGAYAKIALFAVLAIVFFAGGHSRSEERRVGKESRSRWVP